MMMQILNTPSQNHNHRPQGAIIDTIVLHYTGMKTTEAALGRMCDPESEVSAHYLIGENGLIYKLVEERHRSWHAGVSRWRGRKNVNDFSIGIEISNPGHEHGYREFTDAQMSSLIALWEGVRSRHDIAPNNVVTHSDIAPDRKMDPGELFDYERCARHGLGLFVVPPDGMEQHVVEVPVEKLSAFGYHIPYGVDACVIAFSRHYATFDISNKWDNRKDYILDKLLEQV